MKKVLGLSLLLSWNVSAEVNRSYESLIKDINQKLIDNFVYKEIGPKYAARLNQCVIDHCLKQLKSSEEVATRITEMLNDVYADKHLRVNPPGFENPMARARVISNQRGKNQALNTGLEEKKILEGNIGYIRYSMFPAFEEAFDAAKQAMIDLKDTEALIIDIRDHKGGHHIQIDETMGFLFEQPTHFLTTKSPYENGGKPKRHISEPNEYTDNYKDKPVYLLINEQTGSSGEHFVMSMRVTGRAIIVGETTAGMGHWGNIMPLVDGYSIFVPRGRSYHPVNKLGWEAIGVTPDIVIDSELTYDFVLDRIKTHMQ